MSELKIRHNITNVLEVSSPTTEYITQESSVKNGLSDGFWQLHKFFNKPGGVVLDVLLKFSENKLSFRGGIEKRNFVIFW